MRHQLYLCKTIMPLLKKSVVYIIEDVGYEAPKIKYKKELLKELGYEEEIEEKEKS